MREQQSVRPATPRGMSRGELSENLSGRATGEDARGEGGFEFPPPLPDQALLGWRRGQVKNKSNDPAAYRQSEASEDDFGS
jgi:hypothetical protein